MIGRAANCDVQIRAASVSRYHCALEIENTAVYVEDLDSNNGTFVNNRRITERTRLLKGDRIRTGDVDIDLTGLGAFSSAAAAPREVPVPAEPSAAPAPLPVQPAAAPAPRPSVRRPAAGTQRKLGDLALRAGIALVIVIAGLVVYQNVFKKEPEAVLAARTVLARIPEMTGAGRYDEALGALQGITREAGDLYAEAQAHIEEIKALQADRARAKLGTAAQADLAELGRLLEQADSGLETLGVFEQKREQYRGTEYEAAVQTYYDRFRAKMNASVKSGLYAELDEIKRLKQQEAFLQALTRCKEIFEQKDLSEADQEELKRIIKGIAVTARDAADRCRSQAATLARQDRYDEALETLQQAAERFGLFAGDLLTTLGIPACSDELMAEVGRINEAKRAFYGELYIALGRIKAQALVLMKEKKFKEAAAYITAEAAAIAVPKLRQEADDMARLAGSLAAIQQKLIDRLNRTPLRVPTLRGTIVRAAAATMTVKDDAEQVEVQFAWENLSNEQFFHVIRLAGILETDAEKKALGDFFFAIGDLALARLYLKGTAGEEALPGPVAVTSAASMAGIRAGREWPAWSNYTAFIWFSEGPPKSQSAYAALAHYGITGGNVGFLNDSRIESDDPAVDFYVGDASRKGILHLKDDAVKKAEEEFKQNRKETARLIRPFCYNDPKVRSELKDNVRQAITKHKPGGPLAYALGDEIASESFVKPINWCYCAQCLGLFRTWLKSQYPAIGDLNRTWETKFASFDSVVPTTLQETIEANNFFTAKTSERDMRYPELNYASYNDFRTWRDINFAEVLKELVDYGHTLDPDTPIGAVGLQNPSPFGGFDYTRLVQSLDWVEAYDIGESREVIRSFTLNAFPKVETHFIKNDAPVRNKFEAWYYFVHGDRGVIIWSMGGAYTNPPRPQNPEPQAAMPFLKEAYEAFRGGLAQKIFKSTMHTDRIAIYYSQPSIRFSWFVDAGVHGNTWVNRGHSIATEYSSQIKARRAFIDMLENSGYQYEFVSYRAVAEQGISPDEYKILILPKVAALSDKEAAAIRAYVNAGGWVMADYQVGLLDEHLKGRREGVLDDMFGVKRKDYRMTEWYDALAQHADWDYGFTKPVKPDFRGMMAVEEGLVALSGEAATDVGGVPVVVTGNSGKGRTFYLNLNMLQYDDLRFTAPEGAERLRMIVDNIVREAGIVPPVEVYRDGKFYPNIEKIIYNGQGEDYLFVFINANFRKSVSGGSFTADLEQEPHPVTIKLSGGPRSVTRWSDGADLGRKEQWNDLFVPSQPLVYVLK